MTRKESPGRPSVTAPHARSAFWNPDGPWFRAIAHRGASSGNSFLLQAGPTLLAPWFWALRPVERRGVASNLNRIQGPRRWPQQWRDEIATFTAFGRSLVEGIAAFGSRADDVQVDVENEAVLFDLVRRQRGCIFVTAHTSGLEIAASALGRLLGLPVLMAMRAEADPHARRISDEARLAGGLRVVHVGDDPLAVLPLVHHLRRGGAVGLQMDRVPPTVRSLAIPLFGSLVPFPLGPFFLARATGAPLVALFTRRTGFLRVRIQVTNPTLVAPRTGPREWLPLATQIVASLESWVRQEPTEWLDWGRL